MMMEYEQALIELESLARRKESAQQRVNSRSLQYKEAYAAFKKERSDVEKLEEESLSQFVSRIVGTYDKKLDKEKEEQVAAKLELDLAYSLLMEAQEQLDDLLEKSEQIKLNVEQIKKELVENDQRFLQKITDEERMRLKLNQEKKEVDEAVQAGERVLLACKALLAELDSAESYSAWDLVMGKSFVIDRLKYDKIDAAEAVMQDLEHTLEDYKKEVKDLDLEVTIQYERIAGMDKTFDIFFDNIFSDWSVRSAIQRNSEMIETLSSHVFRFQRMLREKKDALEERIEASQKRYGL